MRDVRTLALASAIGVGLLVGVGGATMMLRSQPAEVAAGGALTTTTSNSESSADVTTTSATAADTTSTDVSPTTGSSLVAAPTSSSSPSTPVATTAPIAPPSTVALPTTLRPTTTRAPTTTIAPTTTTSPDPFFDHIGRFFDITIPSTYRVVERDAKKPYGWRTKFENPLSGSYLVIDVTDGPEVDPFDAATEVHDAVLSRNPTDVERTQAGGREVARFYLTSRDGHASVDYFFNANGQPMAGLAVAVDEGLGPIESDLIGALESIR